MNKYLYFASLTAALACLASTPVAFAKFDPSAMKKVDGRDLPKERQWPAMDVVQRFRPWVPEDDKGELIVENLNIHDVTNQKAIDIGLISRDRVPGKVLCYSKVIVRNCDLERINRDAEGQKAGLHIDFLRISGEGDDQPHETDVLIEDVKIHDGSALPLIIQDGLYGTITLRRVSLANTTVGNVQIATINSGSVKQIIVEDSPGLRVAIMGRPGTIKKAIVRNSPGASVEDVMNKNGRTGVEIVREEGNPTTRSQASTTQPANVPLALSAQCPLAGKVQADITGALPAEVSYIVFEAFDHDNYRLSRPVMVTEAPWRAQLDVWKAGPCRIRATIRLPNGLPEATLSAIVDVKK